MKFRILFFLLSSLFTSQFVTAQNYVSESSAVNILRVRKQKAFDQMKMLSGSKDMRYVRAKAVYDATKRIINDLHEGATIAEVASIYNSNNSKKNKTYVMPLLPDENGRYNRKWFHEEIVRYIEIRKEFDSLAKK